MNKMNFIFCVIIFGVLQQYQNVGAIGERVVSQGLSPYLELVLCPGRQQPWNCARDQTARLLDEMNDIVKYQWQMLKVQADRELNTTLQQRGFSSTAVKEKPSTMLKKIEIGTNFIQNFVENTADVAMGRQSVDFYDEDDDDDDDDDDDEDEENENAVDNTNNSSKNKNANQNHIERNQQVGEAKKKGQVSHLQPAIVLLETQKPHQHLGGHGGHGGGHGGLGGHLGGHLLNAHKIGHKKKKKHPFGGGHGGLLGGGHGGIGGGGFSSLFHHNEIGTHALSFLEDLLDSGVSGKPHSHGLNSNNYGRSIGGVFVGRGKKKKKKALMKLMLIGTIIKGKIELLLKILSAHLQVKFFAIALVGLIINIARFWIDIKRGGVPQKDDYIDVNDQAYSYSKVDQAQEANEKLFAAVTTAGVAQKIFRHDQEMFGSYILPALLFNKVLEFPFTVIYYEHAHHQHHYEDHGNVAPSDDWTSATGPSSNSGYWKRSLGDKKREAKSFPPSEETSSSSSYSVPSPIYGANSEQYSAAYNSDPSYLAYSSQLPSYY